MKGYGQFCPIARGAEVFAERWTPIIVRNIAVGARTFSEIISGAPGLSKSLLVERLRTLERVGVVRATPNPRGRGSLYTLTPSGEDLVEVCEALGTWGARWLDVELEHMDPYVVLWTKCRAMDTAALPRPRVVIRFELGDYKRTLWILAERSGAEVCVRPPGFAEDLVVKTDLETLTHTHIGWLSYREAIARGRMALEGPRDLVRAFPSIAGVSHLAHVKPARRIS